MSDLQIALHDAGLLDIVEAAAKRMGTTIEGAIKSLGNKTEGVAEKPKPGTVAFYDAVCAEVNSSDKRGYTAWKEAAEKSAGRELNVSEVLLYAYNGETDTVMARHGVMEIIEGAIDLVIGQ